MMHAVALREFGGAEKLEWMELPVPSVEEGEVLIQVRVAGVGEWDAFEREGGFATALPNPPRFPYVLGSEGAGVVSARGGGVTRFKPGDRVYALSFLNAKGGFYAEYVSVPEGLVMPIPAPLDMTRAAVMGGAGTTALRGLEDTLRLEKGESLLIFGASGGVGHAAVQLAKMMGARTFAVASGADGVALVERLGADAVVDGRQPGVLERARAFAPRGLDTALIVGSSPSANELLPALREGGRVAYPTGIEPVPEARSGISIHAYNGEPDSELIARFDRRIAGKPFHVHVGESFPLREAARAHAAVAEHHLGKLALRIT
jgi:NADPH:quinone reductase